MYERKMSFLKKSINNNLVPGYSKKKNHNSRRDEWNLGNANLDEATDTPYGSPGENLEHFFSTHFLSLLRATSLE